MPGTNHFNIDPPDPRVHLQLGPGLSILLSIMKVQTQRRFLVAFAVLLLLSSLALPAAGQNILRDIGEREDEAVEPRWLALPYAFSTDSLDWAFGVGVGGSGYFQDQLDIMATGFGTTNSSWAGFLAFNDYRPRFSKRLFIDGKGMVGHYTYTLPSENTTKTTARTCRQNVPPEVLAPIPLTKLGLQ